MVRCDQYLQFFGNVIFSDEATFGLNEHVDRHNCRYWSPENLHWAQEHHNQQREKTNLYYKWESQGKYL